MLVTQSCSTLYDSHGLWPNRFLCPLDSPGKNPGVGCHSLLHDAFLGHCKTVYDFFLIPRASLIAQLVKNPPTMWEAWVWSLAWEDPLEKGKSTHSSILAWKIPRTVYSPWGCKESDTTERLSLFLSQVGAMVFLIPCLSLSWFCWSTSSDNLL